MWRTVASSVLASDSIAFNRESSKPGKRASRSSRRSDNRLARPSGRCQITPLSRSTRQWCVSVDFDNPCNNVPHGCSPPLASVRTTAKRSGLPMAVRTFSRRICSRSGWFAIIGVSSYVSSFAYYNGHVVQAAQYNAYRYTVIVIRTLYFINRINLLYEYTRTVVLYAP